MDNLWIWLDWLVVVGWKPLWKIWKSLGMTIPKIWKKDEKRMFQTTSQMVIYHHPRLSWFEHLRKRDPSRVPSSKKKQRKLRKQHGIWCGYSNVHKPPMNFMVGIPPVDMVMNGGWFMILLYQHYPLQKPSLCYPRSNLQHLEEQQVTWADTAKAIMRMALVFPAEPQERQHTPGCSWKASGKHTAGVHGQSVFHNQDIPGPGDNPIFKGTYLSGWWYTYPSEKYESQLGWLFPIYGKI